jgi:hypothetical protein
VYESWPTITNKDGSVEWHKFVGEAPINMGRKNGFCLMDSGSAHTDWFSARRPHLARMHAITAPWECDMKKHCCDQGISSGCADIYDK